MAWWSQPAHLSRLISATPPLSLLRNNILFSLYEPPITIVHLDTDEPDIAACQLLSTNDDIDRRLSFRASITMDSTIHEWKDVASYQTIRCLHSNMMRAATCSQISAEKKKMVYILSKTLPQRCMTRKSDSVCLDKCKESIAIELKIKQLLLCSLLGNYLHVKASSRPPLRLRSLLYSALHKDNKQHDIWFDTLYRKCTHLITFAVRDFTVYAIEDNPSMQEHVEQLFEWHQYREVVCTTMNRIRAYLSFSMQLPNSPFNESIFNPTVPCQAFFDDINEIVAHGHKGVLLTCYKRMNVTITSTLTSLRKITPLLTMPRDSNSMDEDDSSSDSDSDDDNSTDEDDDKPTTALVVGTPKKSNNLDLRSFVSREQHHAMKAVVLRLLPFRSGILMKCVSFFGYFGVDELTVSYVRQIVVELQEGSVTAKQRTARMNQLQRTNRHAYNLLHVTSELVKEAQTVYIVRTLPHHLWVNQIEAIQTRYGITDKTKLLEQTLYFRFCNVCDTVYSLVRDFNSVYKNDYNFGYRDARVDYKTLEIYCDKKRVNHRGTCGEQPLAKVPLLGHLLCFNTKHIILCPQLKCGLPMVLNPLQSYYNRRGVACSECTARFNEEKRTLVIPDRDEKCIKCISKMARPCNTFLFPYGVIVCRKHNFHGLTEFITEKNPTNKEETQKWVVEYIAQKRKERFDARKPQYARDLARQKQRARANIRR